MPLNKRSNVGKRMRSGESTPVGTRDSSTKASRKDDSESDNGIWDILKIDVKVYYMFVYFFMLIFTNHISFTSTTVDPYRYQKEASKVSCSNDRNKHVSRINNELNNIYHAPASR